MTTNICMGLLKKPTLDKDQLSNYHPILNLSLISKIIEHAIKSQLLDHLSSNKLLNPHQSAYCKHHSTEPLLYIRGHLINAIGSHEVSCLCLLDLYAAFGLVCYSWLGLNPICQMLQPSIFLVFLVLQCSSWLCSRSFALDHVHHSTQHSHFLSFSQPPLCDCR